VSTWTDWANEKGSGGYDWVYGDIKEYGIHSNALYYDPCQEGAYFSSSQKRICRQTGEVQTRIEMTTVWYEKSEFQKVFDEFYEDELYTVNTAGEGISLGFDTLVGDPTYMGDKRVHTLDSTLVITPDATIQMKGYIEK